MTKEYDRRLRRISLLRGLRFSRIIVDLMLILSAVLCTVYKYNINSPVLILLFLNLMPFAAETLEEHRSGRKGPDNILPTYSKQYRYSDTSFRIMSVVYLMTCMLLGYWHHVSYPRYSGDIDKLPMLCLLAAFIALAASSIGYYIELKREISKGAI